MGAEQRRLQSLASGRGRGEFSHGFRLGSFGTGDDIELDELALVQGAEAPALNRGVVDEHIAPLILPDEAVPFLIVKPLYCTMRQGSLLLTWEFKSVSQRMPEEHKKTARGICKRQCGSL
jgi:hypothetical protein